MLSHGTQFTLGPVLTTVFTREGPGPNVEYDLRLKTGKRATAAIAVELPNAQCPLPDGCLE
jgi:hypothetical protein